MKSLKFRLFVAAMFLGSGSIAHADILAGVGWAAGQSGVVCYLFNAGPGTVSISSKSIVNELSSVTYSLSTNCGTSLAAGKICAFTTSVSGNGANGCYAVISPSGANVRGEMEVRNSAGDILNSIELR